MEPNTPRNRRARISALLISLALVVAACGDDSGTSQPSTAGSDTTTAGSDTTTAGSDITTAGSDTTTAGSDTTTTGAADLSELEQLIAQYTALPEFVAPGPAFDVAGAEGKTYYNIPASSDIPPIQATDGELGVLAERFGMEFVNWENQGQNSQWIQGIDQAIAQGADVITLEGIPPDAIAPSVTQAREAGIAVIPLHLGDVGTEWETAVDAIVPAPFLLAGELMAAYVVVQSGAEANVLVMTSDDFFPASQQVTEATEEVFATYCPACNVRVVDVPSPDWATRIQTTVNSEMISEPDTDWVIPIFDGMAQYVVAGLESASAEDVGVVTFNGSTPVLQMIQASDVTVDLGENTVWLAWADMDQVLRVLNGVDPVQSENTPVRIWTAENVDEAGTPPELNVGYGTAYVDGYNELWQGG